MGALNKMKFALLPVAALIVSMAIKLSYTSKF